MEFFQDGAHVRLRSREDGTYLHADEDGWGVSMIPHRASLNTAWAVQGVTDMDDNTFVLLRSAAYGGYLGMMNDYEDVPPQGDPGINIRFVQCRYNTPFQDGITWEALEAGDGGGGVVLRRPMDEPLPEELELHWIVEAIPDRDAPPQLPGQIQNGAVPPVELIREIRYVRADNNGIIILSSRGTLQFDGRSLHYLKGDLANELDDNFNNITLCVRAGSYGRITPLVVDLPLNEEMMDIVVLATGSAAAMGLRYPNIDAM